MELTIKLDDSAPRDAIFGAGDCNLRRIREELGVRIAARDSTVRLMGEPEAVRQAADVIQRLQRAIQQPNSRENVSVDDLLGRIAQHAGMPAADQLSVYAGGNPILPKTIGQQAYVDAMRQFDLVICIGPAGTGKTYLAVANAVARLKAGQIQRIVLVRPAVEAGEKLGYLPGDMQAKVNPYLRPLFDAMHDMMSFDQVRRFMNNDVIEVVPLAFMRGRTLNRAAVILDEAQNTTVSQMLMFLTRLGHDSRMIVTGDDSQVDLAPGQRNGLIDAAGRLEGVPGVKIIRMGDADIVRHPLVHRVVQAYNGHKAP